MAQSNWEADKMLDVYIYDYLVKKELHATAKSFMNEGKVAPDPVAIDAPGGFLFEWWSVFWDIFIARTNDKHSEAAAAYIEAQQSKAKEQQQLQMQQLQLMRQAQMQRRDPNHPPLGGPLNSISSEGMLGQSTASALAAKMYEERVKHPNPIDSETSQPLLDARVALLKSTNHPGQMVQGNPGSVNAALQQIQARSQQTTDIKSEVNMGTAQRSLPMDSSIYGQGMMQSKPGMGSAGLSPGVGGLPLKGWPLTGIDQMRPGLGAQVQKPFLQGATQFQLLSQQQQQLLAQVQAQGNVGSSPIYGDMRGFPRGNLNAKDGQPITNNGSIGSPMQSTSSKINMSQLQHSSSQQQQDPLQPQQVQQNSRKRKGPSSSGAANSTGTGNTIGPSPNSQPSTPSTHTPGDGVSMAGNLPNASTVPKSIMMYGADGTGGLASSTNQLDDIEQFGDVGSLEDNVESFLSHDDGDGRDLFGTLKRNPAHSAEASKGFSFSEVGSIRKSSSKVVCCHFSSEGKLLASAGHDKKVVVWNMETLQTESTPEEHSLIITDVRFRPNSTQLATSSFDTTVRLWDAAEPNYSLQTYAGHTSHVMSLDFHPKKNDLFCSCDANNEIRFWNINQYSCTRVSKGGSAQVRFQPRIGQFLAAASGNVVSIFDAESDRQTHSLQGHSTEVHSLCWDTNGDYLASVSQESVRVWSLSSGECIHELSPSGNMFQTCVFHPSYSTLLVIGGYQSLELWNMAENKCMTIQAHEGSVVEPPAQSQTEKLSEPGSDSKPRPIPTAVMKQIRQILKSHPKGIPITDLRMELGKCKLSIDRDFYGYKKFSRFLLSIPHILKVQSLGDGNFLVRGGSEKSSEPCQSNLDMSTESFGDNGGQDLSLASQLDCEDKSINVGANRKLSSPVSHESNVEDPNRELQQPFSPKSDGKSILPPSPENVKSSAKPQLSALDEKSPSTPCTENVKTSVPIDGNVVEVAKEQDNELHFLPAVAQGSSSEVGYFKWIWRQWFGYRGNVSGTRSHDGQEDHYTSGNVTEKEGHDTPVKQYTSVGNSGQRKDKEKLVGSTSQVVDQAPHVSSSSSYNESEKDNKTATSYEVYANKSKTSQGFFDQIVNWCKFWRSSPCSDKLSDQSCDRPNLMNTHSQEHMLFSTDSFWRDMESFMDTPKVSVLASESRTREQMALNLQKEGPLFLRSLSKGDLVHLVDLLISEKKWVEESPSQTSPFKLTYRDGKSSLDHSNDTNRSTSIFLNKPSQHDIQRSREHDGEEKCRNIPHSGVSLPAIKKKPSDRCRIEIIADCQKLVNEILKEYPEGYNMVLFRKLFLDRYGYHLDLHMLGYEKLASLLQMMPGVKVESSYIVPACKTPKMFDMDSYVHNIQKQTVSHTMANSDSELSDASTKDDVSNSPWEELGPVANTSEKNEVEVASRRKAIGSTGFDYEPSLSDDLSDSEGETSPLTELEGEGAARVNKEDSSLLQILDSWYSGKDGGSSKDRSENFEGLVDFTNVSKLSVSSGVGPMSGTYSGNQARKQRPQKNYSFVADSGENKDKLIDGIVGSLKKSSEPRMKS